MPASSNCLRISSARAYCLSFFAWIRSAINALTVSAEIWFIEPDCKNSVGSNLKIPSIAPKAFNSPASCDARAVSADGTVVVGANWDEAGCCEAFRWAADSELVRLGRLPADTQSIAHAVSADGSVIVGRSESASGEEAFRWTQETGMVGLGTPPGCRRKSASWGVSADGSVIVEVTGTESEIDAFLALVRTYGIKESVRTGAVVMARGSGSIEEALKR